MCGLPRLRLSGATSSSTRRDGPKSDNNLCTLRLCVTSASSTGRRAAVARSTTRFGETVTGASLPCFGMIAILSDEIGEVPRAVGQLGAV